MSNIIKILHLEDNDTDSELIKAQLKSEGISFQITRVQSREEFESALRTQSFDLVLADYNLPAYDGVRALKYLKKHNQEIPFIFVSGTIGEEAAIDGLTQGATDYVLKQRLLRLGTTVKRALKETKIRHDQIKAEEELRKSEYRKSILNKIASVFLTVSDEEMYREILSIVLDLTLSKFGLFGFINENGDLILQSLTNEICDECQVSGESIVFPSSMWGDSLWGKAIKEKKPFHSEGPFRIPVGHIQIENFMTVPIVFGNETIGLLSFANKENGYEENDKTLVEDIATFISPILNARLERNIYEQHRSLATEKLLKQERSLLNAQRIARIGSLELDLITNSVNISESFYDIFGLKSNVFADNPEKFFDSVFQDDRPEIEELIMKSQQNLQPIDLIRKIKKSSDGEIRFIHAISDVIHDEQNRPKAIIYTVRDITEIYRTKESLQEYKLAVDQSPVSIVITDIEGNIEYVNPKFTEASGYSLHEVISKNPRILQGGRKSKEEYTELWDTILTGKEWTGEFYNKRKDGTYYWELATISSIRNEDGKISHFIGVKEDISERKKMEEDLKKEKERAEEMSRLKSSLLLNMSHELRTPMNGILGFSELLKEEPLQPRSLEMVNIISSSGKRLMNTLNSILDLSQAESEKDNLKLEITDLAELITKTQSPFEVEADRKKLQFSSELERDVYALVDKRLFQNSMIHLLDNAIKFTESGTVGITLKKEVTPESSFAKIVIRDTGIGISPEKMTLIFDEFRQGSEGMGRHFEGIGLGLTLCKRFIELLGGEILVESLPDIGTTFTVRVKLHPPPVESPGLPDASLDKSADHSTNDVWQKNDKPRVLIVEDNEQNCDLMEVYLQNICQTDIVHSGRQAVKQAFINQYDVILMDINLGPDMDGIQATIEIRKLRNYQTIPIIAVTGFSTEDEKTKILSGGLDNLLSKPFTREKLVGIIKKSL